MTIDQANAQRLAALLAAIDGLEEGGILVREEIDRLKVLPRLAQWRCTDGPEWVKRNQRKEEVYE